MKKIPNVDMMRYRVELPQPIPARILRLPVERGYPVPWFVAMVDGQYDFRIVDARKYGPALTQKLCWICGDRLGIHLAFTIGPMCAVNRVISEPPSHLECADWAARACPFLNQSQVRRREGGMPETVREPAGIGLKRQPGAVCVWVTRHYSRFKAPGGMGFLFSLGEPEEVRWYCEGRAATRDEVLKSIDSGLPLLLEGAPEDAVIDIGTKVRDVMRLLPKEESFNHAEFEAQYLGRFL